MALLLLPLCAIGALAAIDEDEYEREEYERAVLLALHQQKLRAEQRKRLPINVSKIRIPWTNADQWQIGVTLADEDGNGEWDEIYSQICGVRVVAVRPDSLAAEYGLSPGDWITSINGHEVETMAEAIDMMKKARAMYHQDLVIKFASERAMAVNVRVEGKKTVGVTMVNEPNGRGVLVTRLEPDSVLKKNGLRVGDVITSIDGKRTLDHDYAARRFRKAMKKPFFGSSDEPRVVALCYMTAALPAGSRPTGGSATPAATATPAVAAAVAATPVAATSAVATPVVATPMLPPSYDESFNEPPAYVSEFSEFSDLGQPQSPQYAAKVVPM